MVLKELYASAVRSSKCPQPESLAPHIAWRSQGLATTGAAKARCSSLMDPKASYFALIF